MKDFILPPSTLRRNIDYQKELNEEQLDVVLHGDGPCLVLAGAGSGKTRTITYRVAYLLDQGVQPSEILLLTFTNKAAKEMCARVETLLGSSLVGLWSGTFHSVANRILRAYAREVGHTPHFTILDQEDGKNLIHACVNTCAVDTTARRFPSSAMIQSIISYRRNAAQSIREVLESKYNHFLDLTSVLERVDEHYTARKRETDSVDFDDLLLLLRDLLFTRPDIRERLSGRFRYVLVDEYQDTNVIQADIVRMLASTHKNVVVVGDDAQSIYSFRAADIKNILRFPEMHGEAKTFRLEANYRSTSEILHVANAVISHNQNQFKKELRTARETVSAEGGEKPTIVPAAHAQQEAQYVAEQIVRLRSEGTGLRNIAVLFRAAFHSQALEFELMKRGIPYEYRGGMKFFERAHIKDIVAHLRIISNPKDETAWMRVLGLQPGIGPMTADKIITGIRSLPTLKDAMGISLALAPRAAMGWARAVDTFRRVLEETEPSGMIRAVMGGSYREYLEAEYPDAKDRLDDLEQFVLFAGGYDDLSAFLTEVSLTDAYKADRGDPAFAEGEKIILSTIHQAKGLEWDAVFIINLADGKFPNQRAVEEEQGMEEERRLFYVAITRARKRLFLSYPQTTGFDTVLMNQPSPFLLELPKNAVEYLGLRQAPAFEEPTIVFNDLGERVSKKPSPAASFLREIDEL